MDIMLIVIPALLTLIALLAPRYGVDSRDPTARHRRGPTIGGDLRALVRGYADGAALRCASPTDPG